MNTAAKEIWFTTTRTGTRRAYYWSYLAFRALPLPLTEAELLIATGNATQLPSNPWKRG
jgi:hypothetical protein